MRDRAAWRIASADDARTIQRCNAHALLEDVAQPAASSPTLNGRGLRPSFASSESVGGDSALGVLTSPVFVVDRDVLSLRFAAGQSARTRVELHVDGRRLHSRRGRGNNYLERLEFRLEKKRGRRAQLKVIDEDPEAHAMLDHVCFTDGAD